MSEKVDEQKQKKVKKKGPIRFEAIIPTAVIFAGIIAYFTLLFDSNLRMGLEFAGTYIHGAEVNIGSLKTSFTDPSIEIRNIQITDKNKPQRNIIEIGRIKLGLLWDALLRLKIVVPEAAIENIQALSPRKKPGRVIPPSPDDGEGGALAEVEGAVLNKAKSDYEGNVLGDVANMLGGEDPASQLKKIEAELKASGKIKELEAVLKEKEQEWKKRLGNLPSDKDFKAMEARFKALKFDIKNPGQFAKDLKEADALVKEADQKVKLVSQTGKDLDGDLKSTDQALKDIEKMIHQDIKDIQTRLKIPSIDGGDFAKNLFGQMIAEKMAAYAKYITLAKEYMPPPKTEAEKAEAKQKEIVPRARGEGRNVRFPITKGYPTFWLQKGKISSEVSSSNEYSGNISGLVTDVSTAPAVVKNPTRIEIKGDFPKQNIQGFLFDAELDHRSEASKQAVKLAIASYPVGGMPISNSSDVTFNITQSSGQLEVGLLNQVSGVNLKIQNFFNSVQYEVNAKNNIVRDVLNGVAADVTRVSVQADAKGQWTDLDWHVKSNIADAITAAFKKQIEAKIAEAKQKIEKLVNEKIGAEKQKLEAEYKKLKGEVDKVLAEKKAEVDKAKKQVEAEIDKKKKEGSAPVKDIKKEGKKLLKGLGL